MSIYDYETFEFKTFNELKLIEQRYTNKKINLLHRYKSLIWQGPIFAKILSEKLKKTKWNYIVEIGDNIGLTFLLISLKIKTLALDKEISVGDVKKILSITQKKKIKLLTIEKLKLKKFQKKKFKK